MENILVLKENKNYSWYVVFMNALIGCVLSAGFPQSSMTIPYLAEKMKVSQEALLMGDTVKTIGIILSMIISGMTYKKFGAKKVFVFSMSVVIIPMFILPYVKNIYFHYIFKFVQGLSSIVFPVFLIMIMDWVEESKTGLATAIFNGVFYGGGGIGGTLAGFVITKGGWIASYYALAVIQIFVAIIWLVTVKEKATKAVVTEEKKKDTIPFGKLLKMPIVWLFVFSFISTTWCVQAITVDMPLFGLFLGYEDMETGKIMTAVTIGMISACIVSGKASDIFAARSKNKASGRVTVLMAGCILTVLSVLYLIMAPVEKFSIFYFGVLLFSFSASWGLGCFYSILPDVFADETLPVATGFIGGCGDAGMTFAPVVVGVLFGVKGLWNIGWGICVAVALVSIICCIIIIKQLNQ